MSLASARAVAVYALLAVGVANAAALVIGSRALRAVALATRASPLPFVFVQSQDLAGYTDRFALEIETADGHRERRDLDGSVYADLPGPYERRICYGAALSFFPLVRARQFESILRYGLCRGGPLARAAGIAQPVAAATVVLPPGAAGAPERRAGVRCAG